MAFAGRTSPGTDAGPTFAAPLEQIYRDQLQSLVRLLTSYVGVRAGAEDLAHDAFLRANSAWPHPTHFTLGRTSGRPRVRLTAWSVCISGTSPVE